MPFRKEWHFFSRAFLFRAGFPFLLLANFIASQTESCGVSLLPIAIRDSNALACTSKF